jgi:hypothetical protein
MRVIERLGETFGSERRSVKGNLERTLNVLVVCRAAGEIPKCRMTLAFKKGENSYGILCSREKSRC